MNVLFVCGKNQWRSPTAEEIYKNDPRMSVKSAGLSQKSRRRLSEKDLIWADLVLVMEREQKRRVVDQYSAIANAVDIESLDIPDEYPFMDPDLVELLREGVEQLLDDEYDF